VGDLVPLITTERLSLVRLAEQHIDACFAYRSDPLVTQFLTWTASKREEIRDFIAESPLAMGKSGTWFQLAITLSSTDTLIGDIGIHFKEHSPGECELGYTLIPTVRRQGYATEALSAVIYFLFSAHSIEKITCSVDPKNTPSIRLLEKLGFHLEGIYPKSYLFRGELVDDAVYYVEKHDWEGEE
jgi:RimJ/RimL family protein N-acetyltransferase